MTVHGGWLPPGNARTVPLIRRFPYYGGSLTNGVFPANHRELCAGVIEGLWRSKVDADPPQAHDHAQRGGLEAGVFAAGEEGGEGERRGAEGDRVSAELGEL